jgi:hypothetical protein
MDERETFLNQRTLSDDGGAEAFFARRKADGLWGESQPAPVLQEAAPPASQSDGGGIGKQALGGVRDAIQEGLEGIDAVANYLNERNVLGLGDLNEAVFGDKRGLVDPQGDPVKMNLPEVEPPATLAQGMTRGISQFMTGFVPVFRAMKGGEALTVAQGARRAVAAAAVTDFAFFDPHQERLSNLIEEYPALSNPVTRYLQAEPYDTDAEGRMKNVLEGFGVDAGLGGIFMAGLKGYRAARRIGSTPVDEVDAAAEAIAGVAKTKEDESSAFINKTFENVDAGEIAINMKSGYRLAKTSDGKYSISALGENRFEPKNGLSLEAAKEDIRKLIAPAEEVPASTKQTIQFAPPEAPRNILGDAAAPLTARVTRKEMPEVTDEVVDSFIQLDTPAGNKALNINLARIGGTEDIKTVIADTADFYKKEIQAETRSVQTNEVTAQLADRLGMSVDQLLARQQGQAFNAEQAVAARNLLDASANNLTRMARKIRDGQNDSDAVFAFRKAIETHRAIQMQVSGLTAEAGRALQSFNIQAKSRRAQLRAIEDALNARGGRDIADGIADTLVKLADQGADAATVSRTVEKMSRVTSLDTLLTLRQGALLSGYKTHIVNIVSNAAAMMSAVPERFLAGAITSARGGDGVAMREGISMVRGMVGGSWEALSISARAFRDNVNIDVGGKVPEVRLRTITAENLSQNNLGRAIGGASKMLGGKALGQGGYADNVVNGLGFAVDLPFRALGAEDAFFKHLNARMELHALAWRQAEKEGLKDAAAAARTAELVSNPPDEMLEAAVRYARVQTFSNANRTAGAIQAALNNVKIARFVVPFVNTPTNLVKYALDRTPVAPLFADVRADLAAGGAPRALAEARIAMGTTVMLAAGSLAAAGKITGGPPKDPALRAVWLKENQPYSIKTENGWVSYNRTDPWGMVLGMGADMWQASAAADDATLGEMSSYAVIGLSNNVLNKTWLTGLSDFLEAVNDPSRRGEKYTAYMMQSFMPVLMKQMNYDLNDPVVRDFDNGWQAMLARVPGFSDGLPAKRDIWGGLRLYDSGKTPARDPVNELLIRRQIPVNMPPRNLSLGNVTVRLTSEEYSRYVELSRRPAKEMLDNLLPDMEATEGMGAGSDLDELVKKVLRGHAGEARQKIIEEYPEILDRRQDIIEEQLK